MWCVLYVCGVRCEWVVRVVWNPHVACCHLGISGGRTQVPWLWSQCAGFPGAWLPVAGMFALALPHCRYASRVLQTVSPPYTLQRWQHPGPAPLPGGPRRFWVQPLLGPSSPLQAQTTRLEARSPSLVPGALSYQVLAHDVLLCFSFLLLVAGVVFFLLCSAMCLSCVISLSSSPCDLVGHVLFHCSPPPDSWKGCHQGMAFVLLSRGHHASGLG